jgi:hypothetical protein
VREKRTLKPFHLFEAAKRHPWVRASGVVQRAGRLSMQALQRAGVQTWGTKSFECWTLLASALWIVRPRSLLELGSGRSTQYLADYAMKAAVPFHSIEQSRPWARRVARALAGGLVHGDYVHHVPIDRHGWYDVALLDALVQKPCDGIFVDGPIGVQEGIGRAQRTLDRARTWLRPAVLHARLLIIDDVHRPENLALFQDLAIGASGGLEIRYLSYRPGLGAPNLIGFAIEPALAGRLDTACGALGINTKRAPEHGL